MTCKKPCVLCPCKPTTPELHKHIVRSVLDIIKVSGGFPCHEKHPDAHALSDNAVVDGRFHTLDCVGYKLWGLEA